MIKIIFSPKMGQFKKVIFFALFFRFSLKFDPEIFQELNLSGTFHNLLYFSFPKWGLACLYLENWRFYKQYKTKNRRKPENSRFFFRPLWNSFQNIIIATNLHYFMYLIDLGGVEIQLFFLRHPRGSFPNILGKILSRVSLEL